MKTSVKDTLVMLSADTSAAVPAQEATSNLLDPLFLEKLASAVDYIINDDVGRRGTVKVASASDAAVRLRNAFSTRVKVASAEEPNDDVRGAKLIASVLTKIASSAAERLPDVVDDEGYAYEAADLADDDIDDYTVSASSNGDLDGLSLSSIVNGALSGNEQDESVEQASPPHTETGTVREDGAGNTSNDKLRTRLRLILGSNNGAQ